MDVSKITKNLICFNILYCKSYTINTIQTHTRNDYIFMWYKNRHHNLHVLQIIAAYEQIIVISRKNWFKQKQLPDTIVVINNFLLTTTATRHAKSNIVQTSIATLQQKLLHMSVRLSVCVSDLQIQMCYIW